MPLSLIETAAVGAKLKPAPIEPSWIIDGNPQASSCMLSWSADGSTSTIVWHCTEGRFDWHYDFDETILILEGSIVLESDQLAPPVTDRATSSCSATAPTRAGTWKAT